MKKIISKAALLFMMMCVMMFAPVMTSEAAEGTLVFENNSIVAGVGDEITVKVTVNAAGQLLGDIDIQATYDTTAMSFVRGDATDNMGTLALSARGTGVETEFSFELVFQAVAESTTNISVTGATCYLWSDETLNLPQESATVTVGAESVQQQEGDGQRQTSTADIDVNGTLYGIYENFTDALIPEGFSKTTFSYNGEQHNGIVQDASNMTFAFLVNGDSDPIMARYDEVNSKFLAAAEIAMSNNSYIIILDGGSHSDLPEEFAQTTLNLNGLIFPAWQNMSSTDYYLMYALSYTGEQGYYQYDSIEQTYQRYEIVKAEETEEETVADDTFVGKLKNLFDKYALYLIIGIGVVLFILFLIVLVLAIKLGHRNREIDELYDELDEQADDEKQPRGKLGGYEKSGYKDNRYDEDEFDDDYDDEFDDDYDDEYDDDYDEDYDDDDYDDDDYEYDDDDDDIDFIDL